MDGYLQAVCHIKLFVDGHWRYVWRIYVGSYQLGGTSMRRLFRISLTLFAFSLVAIFIAQSSHGQLASRGAGRGVNSTTSLVGQTAGTQFSASDPVTPVLTVPLRDLPTIDLTQIDPSLNREINPRMGYDGIGIDVDKLNLVPQIDPLLTLQANSQPSPEAGGFLTPILNFAGQGFTGISPPDTDGDVGPNHYVQIINSGGGAIMQVFDKTGTATYWFSSC